MQNYPQNEILRAYNQVLARVLKIVYSLSSANSYFLAVQNAVQLAEPNENWFLLYKVPSELKKIIQDYFLLFLNMIVFRVSSEFYF